MKKKQHENLLIFENDLNFCGREKLYNSYKNIFVAALPNDARHIRLSSSIIEYKKDLVEQFCKFFPNSTILSSDLESNISSINTFDIVYPFVGENLTFLERLKSKTSVEYSYLFRHEDHISMQYCQKGFFQFKKNIPKILASVLCWLLEFIFNLLKSGNASQKRTENHLLSCQYAVLYTAKLKFNESKFVV